MAPDGPKGKSTVAGRFTLKIDEENGSGDNIREGLRALDTGGAASKLDWLDPDNIQFVVSKIGSDRFEFAFETRASYPSAKTIYSETIFNANVNGQDGEAFESALEQVGARYDVSGGVIRGTLLNVQPNKNERVGSAFSDTDAAWAWLQREIGRGRLDREVKEAWRDEVYERAQLTWESKVDDLADDLCEWIADVMQIPPEVVDDGRGPDEDEDLDTDEPPVP